MHVLTNMTADIWWLNSICMYSGNNSVPSMVHAVIPKLWI